MDVERAEAELDAFIERRTRERSKANALEEMYAESVRRHRERIRRQNRALWFAHYANLADSLRRSADVFDRKAEALMEEGEAT